MYILKQGNLIAYAAKTEEEIISVKEYMPYDEIVETEETYILKNGVYLTEDEALIEQKAEKHAENTQKAKQAVENGYVSFKEAQFETNAQTVGDLTATMLMLQNTEIATGASPLAMTETVTANDSEAVRENTSLNSNGIATPLARNDKYFWLSKDDKVVELTLDDFITLGNLIAEYKNSIWSNKYIAFKTAIENAATIEELEEIQINYAGDNLQTSN